jgi:hypothetical protein
VVLCLSLQPARSLTRFNRQWKRPALSSALSPAARASAPVCGLAGSGSRLVLAAARDWNMSQVGRWFKPLLARAFWLCGVCCVWLGAAPAAI